MKKENEKGDKQAKKVNKGIIKKGKMTKGKKTRKGEVKKDKKD